MRRLGVPRRRWRSPRPSASRSRRSCGGSRSRPTRTPSTWRSLVAVVVAARCAGRRSSRRRARRPDDPRLRARADRRSCWRPPCSASRSPTTRLTLLLIPAVGLFVLAVDRGVLRRPRLVAAALGACLGVAACCTSSCRCAPGPFRAPLVYGHPETWSGFWDDRAGAPVPGRPRGPLADLAGQGASLHRRSRSTSSARWLLLVPPACSSRPCAARATPCSPGVALLTTCLFAASYSNAAIERYYIGPGVLRLDLARDPRRRASPSGWSTRVVARTSTAGAASTGRRPRATPAARGRAPLVGVRSWAIVLLAAGRAAQLQARWRVADRSNVDLGARAGWTRRSRRSSPTPSCSRGGRTRRPCGMAQLVEHRRPDIGSWTTGRGSTSTWARSTDVIEANLDTRPVYVIRVAPSEVEALGRPLRDRARRPPGQPLPGRRAARRPAMTAAPAPAAHGRRDRQRVPRLSYFFPAHNEEANLEGLVDGGARDAAAHRRDVRDHRRQRRLEGPHARRSPTGSPRSTRASCASSTTTVNRGYGGALRSGFEASRYELLAFTDGDRQFRVADLARLTARLAEPDRPDVVVGYRIKRADPIIRDRLRPHLQARQPHLLRPAGHATWTAPASCSAARPWRASGSSRAAPSSRRSC